MTRKSQNSIGALVFAGAIFIGMQMASRAVGQTPPPATSATPPPTAPQSSVMALPESISPFSPAPPAPGTAVAAPPASVSNATPPAGAAAPIPAAPTPVAPVSVAPVTPPPAFNGGATMPAFGPGAIKNAEAISSGNEPVHPAAPVVPKHVLSTSEVQTYVPSQVRQGDPRAILHTSLGDIKIRLFQSQTPKTVRNFIDLARGDREFIDPQTSRKARRPFYLNMVFHRVMPGHLVQTGCPFGNGRGGPGYVLPDEFASSLRFSRPYMVAMAAQRDDTGQVIKNSNGSQFFITLAPAPEWDEKFTIFGQVESGQAIVNKIAASKTGPTDRPIRRVFLFNVDILDETTSNVLPPTASGAPPSAQPPPIATELAPPIGGAVAAPATAPIPAAAVVNNAPAAPAPPAAAPGSAPAPGPGVATAPGTAPKAQ